MRINKPFFAYRSFNKESVTTRRFYDAGVRQFCLFPANTVNSLGQYYSEYPPNWLYFDVYEFEHVDRQFRDLLAIAPEAQVILMIDLNTPYWMVRALATSYSVVLLWTHSTDLGPLSERIPLGISRISQSWISTNSSFFPH